jgi:hypothetical protein
MDLLKFLTVGAVAGVVVAAFRDTETGGWLPLGGYAGAAEIDETEPVLGYDGMDRDTLIDWLAAADLDRETLRDIRGYENAHHARRPVLNALEDLLG